MEVFRTCALLVIIATIVHMTWEYMHFGLYAGYEHWTGGMPVYVLATAGDVLYTLGAFALVAAIKKSYMWVSEATLSDYFTLVTIGFFIALFVEYKGIALHKWQYLPEMPLIPFFNVGLSPIVQMAVLLPLTVFLAHRVLRVFRA